MSCLSNATRRVAGIRNPGAGRGLVGGAGLREGELITFLRLRARSPMHDNGWKGTILWHAREEGIVRVGDIGFVAQVTEEQDMLPLRSNRGGRFLGTYLPWLPGGDAHHGVD